MTAHRQSRKTQLQFGFRWLILLAVIIGVRIGFPHYRVLIESTRQLRGPSVPSVIVGVLAIIGTYMAAAATYYCLLYPKLHYKRTALVALASVVFNRLVPGGLGGIGAMYQYFRHSDVSSSSAAAVIALNNSLGLVGNVLIDIILVGLEPRSVNSLRLHSSSMQLLIGGLVVASGGAAVVAVPKLRKRIAREAIRYSRHYQQMFSQPNRVLLGFISSMGLTLLNMICLWSCIVAVHGSLSFIVIAISLSIGVAAGTITPTPGGLGGFEVGLIAALIAGGLNPSLSVSAVVLFRLISYLMPLLLGGISLIYVRKKGYL